MKKKLTTFAIVFLSLWTFQANAQSFQVDDVQCGTNQYRYTDPEFLDSLCLVTYIDNLYKTIWVGQLDPVTGLFSSVHGQDYLIQSAVVPIDSSHLNGPEWGLDTDGPAVFYTKRDNNGIRHLWRGVLYPTVTNTQLSSGSLTHYHWQGTTNPSDTAITVFFIGTGLNWSNENSISYNYSLPNYYWGVGSNGPRFIKNSQFAVYQKEISPGVVEIARVNILTASVQQITNDSVPKNDVWGIVSPEFNNETIYCAKNSDTTVAFYRFINFNDPYATKFIELKMPPGEPRKYVFSAEAFVFDNKTYIAVVADTNNNAYQPTNSSIWILGMDGIFSRRVDEGAVTGINRPRIEPEVLITNNEVFIYYNGYFNYYTHLRRCKTGLVKNTTSVIENSNSRNDISIFPDPANDIITVSNLPNKFMGTISIFSTMGQKLMVEHKTGSQFSIETGQLNRGIYFLQIKDENGEVIIMKFIKQ